VEILPVLMKFLINLGQETNYDRVLRRAEERDFNAFNLDADAAHQAAAARANLVVDDEKDRVAGQKQVLAQINHEVIQRQKEVVTEALRLWSAHAKQQSARVLASYQQSLQPQTAPATPVPGPPTRPTQPPSMPPPGGAPTVATRYGVSQSSSPPATDSTYVTSMQLPPEDEV
jgi:acetolactate synthase regulatory subunit